MRCLKIIILIIIGSFVLFGYYLYSWQITKKNVQKTEAGLANIGFKELYQKEEYNKFCVKGKGAEQQKEIINDMIWTLENIEKIPVREIKEIECEDGSKGVEIR